MASLKTWKSTGFLFSLLGFIACGVSRSLSFFEGRWKILKSILYGFLILFMWVMIFFSHKFPKAHCFEFVATLGVFSLTFAISLYLDKIKPDIWVAIGAAAFAITFLSMSRARVIGFQTDCIAFFLTVMLLQLIRLKHNLKYMGMFVVFGIFSTRLWLTIKDAKERLKVDDLANETHKSIKCLQEGDFTVSTHLLQKVKHFLEGTSDLEHVPDSFVVDEMSIISVENVNALINLGSMILRSEEAEKDFCGSFQHWRNQFLTDLIHLMLPVGSGQIGRFPRASRVALEVLLPCERILGSVIFLQSERLYHISYTTLCTAVKLQLLDVAASFVEEPPSLRLLFDLADVYESIAAYLHHPCNSIVVGKTTQTLHLVDRAIRCLWAQYGKYIQEKMGADLVGSSTKYIITTCRSRRQVIEGLVQHSDY